MEEQGGTNDTLVKFQVDWLGHGNMGKTMKSNQLLCGRGVPCKDEGLEKGIYLSPILLIMITSFIHEMSEDMPCMHRILHVDKNSEDCTLIMSH